MNSQSALPPPKRRFRLFHECGSVSGISGIFYQRLLLLVLGLLCLQAAIAHAQSRDALMDDVRRFAALGDRSTGTPGCAAAAALIRERFTQLGLEAVDSQHFGVPVMRHGGSRLDLPGRGQTVAVQPVLLNAITPQAIPPEGLQGPLVYVGSGHLAEFNGKQIEGAIVLMDIDSGRRWEFVANLGARALIYLDREDTPKALYRDKLELSPIYFPRFRIAADNVRRIFGDVETIPDGRLADDARLVSQIQWVSEIAENVYGLIPGADPELKDEVVVVEAFYDATALVPGMAPGADEALSIATLLELADRLRQNPPGRSVLLVATAGHAQTLFGMREMIWSLKARTKDLRDIQKDLQSAARQSRDRLALLNEVRQTGLRLYFERQDSEQARLVLEALGDQLKTEVDMLSRRLMRLRMESRGDVDRERIQALARERTLLRRIGWRSDPGGMPPEEIAALTPLVKPAIEELKKINEDARRQEKWVRSAKTFRSLAKSMEIAAVVSLHLSSHGDGFGAFNYGWLYPLRPRINRTGDYAILNEVLHQGAAAAAAGKDDSLYRDTLRPSRLRSWQSYFVDRPFLGGEVSALAGYLGVTLATVNDARPQWGTPADRPAAVERQFAERQSRQVAALLHAVTVAPQLHDGNLPRDGFTTLTGRAKFLRHGELFPDQPAPETVVMAFQGPGRYYGMVDGRGIFTLKGVSTKKLVQDKVIIEAYRFDPTDGKVLWAIDKKQTGKNAYRVKVERSNMETDLVMFGCKQTTIFSLLEPRSFRYMTKIQLIDSRREAVPVRYWWSRIDTWSSTLASLYLEPGTPMKMTLSDSVLRNKLLLLNADAEAPEGTGYVVDDWPYIHRTDYMVARDMWALLGPRIRNLEVHGIRNERITLLQQEGKNALVEAEQALAQRQYDRFAKAAASSWALASRVYNDVEDTQKDVLFGVLFYIALFVPFAFCMERLLFSYTDIHRRILAFCAILLLVIAVIYKVHPAFQLAYSPTVVILAFFIMGLSLIVTLIIYLRFEQEMVRLQHRARQTKAAEIGRWKAFTAAFFLGVSNLRRRRLRTALTCATLVILTFTVMSFTSVKSLRHHARLMFNPKAPYNGYLFKNVNWTDLPIESLEIVVDYFGKEGLAVPRVWLEDEDPTRTPYVPIRRQERTHAAVGVVGLSADEKKVTGLDRVLVGGRWFDPQERRAVLLPEQIAVALGIDPLFPGEAVVELWGVPFRVVGVFSGRALMESPDLDGEPLTPVTFPSEVSMEMTEIEMEALESGEDIRSYQSRYQHTDAERILIVPHQTLLASGGRLKDIAVKPRGAPASQEEAERLVDRFGLTIFSGETDGTFLYQASDTMSYSGVPNVAIPMAISIFIVLNTMIGSVYERKREIAIYTSVGLAPSHVSFLFIAEALAFAVISVVLGYLLAQVAASLFAGTSLWAGITVNYSSMAGVAAMVLVILVVLISAIYPSRVAAEIAIPDVNRSWKLPEARGNRLNVTLPFLMNFREHLSIGGFLLDHFEGHRDVSHGLFSAGALGFSMAPCQVPAEGSDDRAGEGSDDAFLQLTTDIWLAPFDFGIMQKVVLAFCRSAEDPGFLEIRVLLERQAGEANAWRRINKAFLHELRKQLLIWRSLDPEAKKHYEKLILDEADSRGTNLSGFLQGAIEQPA